MTPNQGQDIASGLLPPVLNDCFSVADIEQVVNLIVFTDRRTCLKCH